VTQAPAEALVVDGEGHVRRVRRVKSGTDVDAIKAAVDLAEDCLGEVLDAVASGVRERELVGVFEARMASHGVSTPAFEGTFVVADGTARSLVTDRVLESGDVVHLRGGALRDGWEGWLSRTALCDTAPTDAQRRAFASWRAAMDAALECCRPGVTVGDVRRAATGATVDGVGMGHEELADDDPLEPGMVLAVEVTADEVLGSEVVVVGDDVCTLLTRAAHPLA
jgi:Xaa-Pro aminopeptidase